MNAIQRAAWSTWMDHAPEVVRVMRDVALERGWTETTWPSALGATSRCDSGYPLWFRWGSPLLLPSRIPGETPVERDELTRRAFAYRATGHSYRWAPIPTGAYRTAPAGWLTVANRTKSGYGTFPVVYAQDRVQWIEQLGKKILPLYPASAVLDDRLGVGSWEDVARAIPYIQPPAGGPINF